MTKWRSGGGARRGGRRSAPRRRYVSGGFVSRPRASSVRRRPCWCHRFCRCNVWGGGAPPRGRVSLPGRRGCSRRLLPEERSPPWNGSGRRAPPPLSRPFPGRCLPVLGAQFVTGAQRYRSVRKPSPSSHALSKRIGTGELQSLGGTWARRIRCRAYIFEEEGLLFCERLLHRSAVLLLLV